MNKKKTNKKGFTLIEILAVIVIIGIISSIAFAVYFNVIDKSKNTSADLAMNNIKNAAELYIKESFDNAKWNTLDENNQYVCITILELINAGYFKEDFFKDELYKNTSINSNTYVSIIRNSNNKADLEISILDDDINTNEKCQAVTSNENIKTEFKESNREVYTDTINLKVTSLPNDEYQYKCAIKKSDSNSWTNYDATNKVYCLKTNLDGLSKYNGEYTVKVCLDDGTIGNCSDVTDKTKSFEKNIKLSDFEAPKITFDPDIELSAYRNVTITYSNKNIYNNEGYHYFKSDVNGELENNQEIYLCDGTSINTIETCTTKATSIEANKIYFTESSEITFKINQNITTTSEKIYAYIKDKSDNVKYSYEIIPKINTTIPSCEIVLTGTKGNNGYYKSNVEVKLNTGVKDDVTATTYGLVAGGSNKKPTNGALTLTQTSNTAGITYYGYVKYSNGAESTCTKTFKIDKSAPTCVVTKKKSKKEDMSSLSSYDGSWYSGYARTIPTCTDTGGSGCNESYKVVVDASKSNATKGTFTDKKLRDITGQGLTKHTWTVYDKAGNSTTCDAVTIRLDRTGPGCSVSKSNTKTTSGVTAKFNCTDKPTDVSSSGVASCIGTKTGLKSGSSYSIKDNAGNTGTCKVTISTQKQYRSRTRSSSCKSCSKAGCKTYKTCKTSACGINYATKNPYIIGPYTSCPSGSSAANKLGKANASCTYLKKVGSGHDENYNTTYSCYYSCKYKNGYKSCTNKACGCKTYKTSCSSCGTSYGSWGSWSSWSTSSCSPSTTKQCESRTVYY